MDRADSLFERARSDMVVSTGELSEPVARMSAAICGERSKKNKPRMSLRSSGLRLMAPSIRLRIPTHRRRRRRRRGLRSTPVNRSSADRTASRVLRSLTASSKGAEAGERRIRLSGSGKINGSSHGPCTTNGRSKSAGAFGVEIRLATPLRSYSRAGTEAVPVSVRREPVPRGGRPRRWRYRR